MSKITDTFTFGWPAPPELGKLVVTLEYKGYVDPYFSITGDVYRPGESTPYLSGPVPHIIENYAPQYARFLKWHLFHENGPKHYLLDAVYFARAGKFAEARKAAYWPEATDEQLSLPRHELTALLEARLPGLIREFHRDISGLFLDVFGRTGLKPPGSDNPNNPEEAS